MMSSFIRCCSTGLMLVGLAVPAWAQTNAKASAAKDPVKETIKSAIRASNDHQYVEAIQRLDMALQQSPNNRDALDIMALVAGMASDSTKDIPTKITYLRKATAAFDRLAQQYNPLDEDEVRLGDSLKLDPARIEVMQGKPERALDLLTKLVAGGYKKSILIELVPDFEVVRKLPGYADRMTKAYQTAAKADLAEFKPFAFDFDLKTVEGKPIHLADYKGDVTIVDIWGTWCPPCREEIPHLVNIAHKYGDKGLKVVGVNCNEEGDPAEIKKTINDFIAELKIPYPCVLNDETIQSKVPDFKGYPTLLILDRQGNVRLSMMGLQAEPRLEAIISILMAESSR